MRKEGDGMMDRMQKTQDGSPCMNIVSKIKDGHEGKEGRGEGGGRELRGGRHLVENGERGRILKMVEEGGEAIGYR